MLGFTISQSGLAWALFAIILAIGVPLQGALVRFRALYNPKGLQLHPEGGVQAHTGPVITSFFALLVRVYRTEGWSGLYKGLMPTLVSPRVVITFLLFSLNDSNLRRWIYRTANLTDALRILPYESFFMLISLPREIITFRAITTPHKLPYFNPVYALRVLLTPTERRRPWILYRTPGFLAARVLQVAYVVLRPSIVRRYLLRNKPAQFGLRFLFEGGIPAARLTMFFVFALASTVVLAPLQVIAIRLAIQRNHAVPEFNSVSQEEEGDAEGTLQYSGIDEDVIGLRTEQGPYTGLVDCAKRIIEEEGCSALYRAWWLTMLACLQIV